MRVSATKKRELNSKELLSLASEITRLWFSEGVPLEDSLALLEEEMGIKSFDRLCKFVDHFDEGLDHLIGDDLFD
jgi:hypothetical protein